MRIGTASRLHPGRVVLPWFAHIHQQEFVSGFCRRRNSATLDSISLIGLIGQRPLKAGGAFFKKRADALPAIVRGKESHLMAATSASSLAQSVLSHCQNKASA